MDISVDAWETVDYQRLSRTGGVSLVGGELVHDGGRSVGGWWALQLVRKRAVRGSRAEGWNVELVWHFT